MTEDPRIGEIRTVLDRATLMTGPATLSRIRAIVDQAPAAPPVFLPGDVLPPNVAIMNIDGVLYGPAPGWVVSIPGVEIPLPTAARVLALVQDEAGRREELAFVESQMEAHRDCA